VAPSDELENSLPLVVRQRILAVVGELAALRSEAELRRALASWACELGDADDAEVAFVDEQRACLWIGASEWPWEHGFAGAAARERRALVAEHACDVPREHELLAGVTKPRDHLVAVPLPGADGQSHAVLLASRAATRDAFGADAVAVLTALCTRAGAFLEHVAAAIAIDAAISAPPPHYRAEAKAALAAPARGHAVTFVPPWAAATFWLIAAATVACVVFLCLASRSRYSSGPAIVHDGRRHAVVAHAVGTVGEIAVATGDSVDVGETLVVLDDPTTQAELERLAVELDRRTRQHLLDLDDVAAADAVAELRQRMLATRARLGERIIRAPVAGVIADLRVAAGRPLAVGDVVATIDTGEGELQLLAFLPGDDRPALAQGMHMRFDIPGYRHDYQWFTITAVEDAAVGPREAARMLGTERADSVPLAGPTVLARGEIPEGFVVDDRLYAYHDGMLGIAEVRLEREPLLFVLLPFLSPVFR
jgi:biotin carboxyl carrier protein